MTIRTYTTLRDFKDVYVKREFVASDQISSLLVVSVHLFPH